MSWFSSEPLLPEHEDKDEVTVDISTVPLFYTRYLRASKTKNEGDVVYK